MILELVEAALAGGAITGWMLDRRTRKPVAEPQSRCSGYRIGHGVVNKMKRDCHGVRAVNCLDGRCSYHCSQMCKCATPEGLR